MGVYVHIQHKMGQWNEFERIFTADTERRRALGSKGGAVTRSVDDPSLVFVVLEWESLEKAKTFVDSLETHEAMQWATSGIWSRVHIAEEVLVSKA
jgi:heme-degrading monooxygenase HmoA